MLQETHSGSSTVEPDPELGGYTYTTTIVTFIKPDAQKDESQLTFILEDTARLYYHRKMGGTSTKLAT